MTTEAGDPGDSTPPTTPANLSGQGMFFGEELWLFWDESTDNVTSDEAGNASAPATIAYDLR